MLTRFKPGREIVKKIIFKNLKKSLDFYHPLCYTIIVPRDSEKVTESVMSRINGMERYVSRVDPQPVSQPCGSFLLWNISGRVVAPSSIQIEYREENKGVSLMLWRQAVF